MKKNLNHELHSALMSGPLDLPGMPELAIRIGKAIDSPHTSNSDIARLIQLDPSLAARLISLVNSAAFFPGIRIQNLPTAVARLGREKTRNLVYSCVIKGMFRTTSGVLLRRMQSLWNHSCQVAAISYILAKITPGLDPEEALLSGLVHDIGAIPIINKAGDFPALLRDPDKLEQVIEEFRTEIGVLTLQKWRFPEPIIEVVRHAEEWTHEGDAQPSYSDVVIIAQLHSYIGLPRMEFLPRIDDVPAFGKLALGKLTPRRTIALLDRSQRELEGIQRLLNN